MAGRRAQPIAVLKANGRKHLTKGEIEHRQKAESEIKFGTKDFKCPEFIKNDLVAYKRWLEITKDYRVATQKGIDLFRSPDVGLLARYCKTFSEYLSLSKHRDNISNAGLTNYEKAIAEEELEGVAGEITAGKILQKIDYILSVDGILGIETAINKKMDMLIKMEDRLFLNPLSKIKNIPKSPPKQNADPNAGMFGD